MSDTEKRMIVIANILLDVVVRAGSACGPDDT